MSNFCDLDILLRANPLPETCHKAMQIDMAFPQRTQACVWTKPGERRATCSFGKRDCTHGLKPGRRQFLCKCLWAVGILINSIEGEFFFLMLPQMLLFSLLGEILQNQFEWHRMGEEGRCGKRDAPADRGTSGKCYVKPGQGPKTKMLCKRISQQDKTTRTKPKSEALSSEKGSTPASLKKKSSWHVHVIE